jgi:ClpP class serine protease
MPTWANVQNEVRATGSAHDVVRRKYIEQLADVTGRNVIVYYSGWLEKNAIAQQNPFVIQVNDSDKNGFMAALSKMDRSKGLDLVLHTPGGDIAATESLVDYLRSMFDTDIRAIVPQLAMSAGTMIALSCKQIVMGLHSSLGPIDPQIGGRAAHGLIEEFNRAVREVKKDPAKVAIWQPIIAKYSPTLVGECEKAMMWANLMVSAWLETGMFKDMKPVAKRKLAAKKVLDELSDHALTMSHARHISAKRASELGLDVFALESDAELQDAVLSVHHACILTLAETPAIKIIENQVRGTYITSVNVTSLALPFVSPPPTASPPPS